MAERFYTRVMTRYGNDVHLTEVGFQHRKINLVGLKTLCNRVVFISMDACADELSCGRCAKAELKKPLRRRSRNEGGLGPSWQVRKAQWKTDRTWGQQANAAKTPDTCPHPARDGSHEEYLRPDGSTFCRACGAELRKRDSV